MLILMAFWACGEKETDTGASEDTATETNTEETDTEDSDTEDTGAIVTNEIFAQLEEQGGCGDYFMYSRNRDDTITLHIQGTGLAQQAHEAGEEIEMEYSISPEDPSIQPSLILKMGSNLNAETCTDVFEQTPTVDTQYVATSGLVSFRVTPDGEATEWGEYPAIIDVTLMDVCFGETEPICIEAFGFASFVGWLPGK